MKQSRGAPVAAVADEVDDHVAVELLAPLGGQLEDAHHGLRSSWRRRRGRRRASEQAAPEVAQASSRGTEQLPTKQGRQLPPVALVSSPRRRRR